MDIKVNQIQTPQPIEAQKQVQQTDSNFKFMLASHIAEANPVPRKKSR